jgi:hypothetical protein
VRIGCLGLVAVALVAVLGCTSAAPVTPSPGASVSVTSSPSAIQSTTGGPIPTPLPTPQVIVTAIPMTPAPTQAATASASSTTTASQEPPTTAPSSAPLILDWQRSGDPGMGSAEDIYASAASGDRVVAVGDDSDANPVIWTTKNGTNWTLGDTSYLAGFTELNDVSAYDNGFVVVGNEELDTGQAPLVLKSSDGTTWQHDEYQNMADGNFAMVASVGSNVVIAGDSNGVSGLFVSHQDASNTTFSGPNNPLGIGTNGVEALTATSDAFWAFDPTNGTDKPIEVWRSADGDNWTDIGSIPGSAGVQDVHVANGPLGWVVTGDSYKKQKQVNYAWWSADGVTWQLSSNPPFAVSDIFADDSGFIIAGKWLPKPSGCALDPAEYAGVSWTSTDGLLWHRQSDDGWQSQWIEQLRRYNRTLIGIGIDYTSPDDTGVGAIWTAKLPSLATDNGPVPSNPPSPTGGGCGP